MNAAPRRAAGAVVFRRTERGPRLLLLRAYRNWDFPKGMIERGESELDAAKRETLEETGLADLDFPFDDAHQDTLPYAGGKVARYFLAEFSAEYGKKTRELTDGAMEILLRYPWPGNVRELRNLVERLVIVCPQARIEPHHLPPELFRGVAESPQQPYSTLHEARSAYEREFILRKLQEHRWNMTQTASALGLERSHLYRKMKSLGIAAPE